MDRGIGVDTSLILGAPNPSARPTFKDCRYGSTGQRYEGFLHQLKGKQEPIKG